MAITQETHWDNVGTEPGAGDAEYVAGQQPISEHDNWFNWSAAKDVENLIAALENVATGHDHDGTDSKKVDGGNVINTPAGNIAATDVQAAIDELDTEKAPLASPVFTGLVRRYSSNGIVAYAGGGQANAIQLSANINEISVCATAGDSVKLPDGERGREIVVINNGAAALDVFPISGDYINNVLDTAVSIPVGYSGTFNCYTGDRWDSYIPIAGDVANTPAGNIAATDVQAAINELDTEKLAKVLFNANTVIKADSNDTPAALTVAEQTLVGRITAGVITALTVTQVRTLLNVADGANVTPVGAIIPYGGAAAPSGYLLCNGAAISRSTYSDLFGVISTSFGVGDGSTTFNVPDMQGNVPVGKGGSGVTSIGDVGGEQDHTLTENEMPAHNHEIDGWGSGAVDGVQADSARAKTNTSSVGGGAAHENMQPYVGTEYIIKT